MKNIHHTKKKEKRTIELLNKVLNKLVKSKVPISLNGNTYKSITMSAPQIIDAMYEYAEPSELIDGIIIKNKSSLSKSKNEIYFNMKENAKKDRASFLLEGSNTQFKEEPSLLDLKLAVESLTIENDKLKTELARKNNLIKLNEFNESISNVDRLKNYLPNDMKSENLNSILVDILTLLSDTSMISISKSKNGKIGEVNYRFLGKSYKICNIYELENLMEIYIDNSNGIDVIKIRKTR